MKTQIKLSLATVIGFCAISASAADFNISCTMQEKVVSTGDVLNYQGAGIIKNIQPNYGSSGTVELILRNGKNPIGVAVNISNNILTKDGSLKAVSMGTFSLGDTKLGQARETLGLRTSKTKSAGLVKINEIDGLQFSLNDIIEIYVPQEGGQVCGGGYEACPPSYGSGEPTADPKAPNVLSNVSFNCQITQI